MLLSEFVLCFAGKYAVKQIDDVDHGIFKENIKGDIYLVENEKEPVVVL